MFVSSETDVVSRGRAVDRSPKTPVFFILMPSMFGELSCGEYVYHLQYHYGYKYYHCMQGVICYSNTSLCTANVILTSSTRE